MAKLNLKKIKQKHKRVKKIGLPPGSLIFTGKQKMEQSDLTLMLYKPEKASEIKFDHTHTYQKSPDEIAWYDIRGVHDVAIIEQIGKAFDIHPLVLEDVLNTQQRPKFEEYENGIFIIIKALSFEHETQSVQTEQVSVFFGKGFLISFQEDKTDLLQAVRERINGGRGKIRGRGSDYLAYALLDNIVDYYFVILDQVEEEIDKMEEAILLNPESHIKSAIHRLKRELLMVRKSISPLREAISRFSKSEHHLVDESSYVFIRDLYDHTIQIMDMVETYRDTLSGLQDLYLSELSYKMNNVMQVLTIMATIFIPCSFLAGVYGMNFENLPELHWKYSYFVFWAIILVIIGGSMYYFRKKRWL